MSEQDGWNDVEVPEEDKIESGIVWAPDQKFAEEVIIGS
jgi:hypothetical protein